MKTLTATLPTTTSRCPIHRLMAWLGLPVAVKAERPAPSSDTGGRCPLGFDAPGSAFTNKASHEVETAPTLPGDPAAQALLDEARAAIYHWPTSFPGFSCTLQVLEAGHTWSGQLTARSSRDYQITSTDSEPPGGDRWLRYHLEEFLAHREHPSISRMTSRTGVTFGEDHPIYGRRIDFLGDKMNSFYHIADRRIRLIGRSYPKESFLITIDRHLELNHTFAATDYSAFYWSRSTGQLLRTETYRDQYVPVGDLLLPASRIYTVSGEHATLTTRLIRFLNPHLLA
ncbi:MAG: hypothetical protein OHK005_12880 [Candidatus Methylacidiphilales bacterium]